MHGQTKMWRCGTEKEREREGGCSLLVQSCGDWWQRDDKISAIIVGRRRGKESKPARVHARLVWIRAGRPAGRVSELMRSRESGVDCRLPNQLITARLQ